MVWTVSGKCAADPRVWYPHPETPGKARATSRTKEPRMLWLLSHPARGLAGRTKKAQGLRACGRASVKNEVPEGRLRVVQDASPGLAWTWRASEAVRDCVLGYFQPSLRALILNRQVCLTAEKGKAHFRKN